MEKQTYEVESFSIGNVGSGKNRIIFKSVEDMEQAYKDIDNGRDILIVKDGVVTKILNQSLSTAIYDLRIELSANQGDSA